MSSKIEIQIRRQRGTTWFLIDKYTCLPGNWATIIAGETVRWLSWDAQRSTHAHLPPAFDYLPAIWLLA